MTHGYGDGQHLVMIIRCHMDFLRNKIKYWDFKNQMINKVMKISNATCDSSKWPNMVTLKMF
jgi:hypothetical protein